MYLSQAPGTDGPTTLSEFDTSSNPFVYNDLGSSSLVYNGTAFNPGDNRLYAIRSNDPNDAGNLVAIGSNGVAQDLGGIAGLPDQGFLAGEIAPDGTYYVLAGSSSSTLYEIDIDAQTASPISLTPSVSLFDFAWHNGQLYGAAGGTFYSIDPSTGAVTTIGATHPGSFGAMFGTPDAVYGAHNGGDGFFRFDLATGDATLISNAPGASLNDGAKCASTTLDFPVDLNIGKDDGSTTYVPGSTVTYTIPIGNDGSFGVQGATVTDPLPTGISTANWTCGNATGGATCGAGSGSNANGNAIDGASVSIPVGGSVEFQLTLTVPTSFSGDLVNNVSVAAPAGSPDSDTSNNSASDTDVSVPRLTLQKNLITDDGGDAVIGDFTLEADGPGSTDLSGVSGTAAVTDQPVVAGTYTLSETNVSGYSASDYSCSIDGGAAVTGNTIDLQNSQTAICTITNDDQPATLTLEKDVVNNDGGVASESDFTLEATGPVTISGASGDASVTGASVPAGSYTLSETGPAGYTEGTFRCSIDGAAAVVSNSLTLDEGESAVCTITNDDIPPDVSILKELVGESDTVDEFPQPGEMLTYEITLSNSGGTASGYDLEDQLDTEAIFQSADNGGVHSGASPGGVITWTDLEVPAEDAGTPGQLVLTVEVQVDPGIGGGENVQNIVKEPTNPDPECPSDQCVTIPPLPSVTIDKTLVAEAGSKANVAEAGEQLTYQIRLENAGSETTTYDLTDELDSNTVFSSADNGGSHDGASNGGTILWNDLTVPGASGGTPGVLDVEVVAVVVDPIPAGVTEISNLAYETGETPPSCPSDQCATTSTDESVSVSKELTAEDGSEAGVAEPGETLTYEITLTNTGGSDASYDLVDDYDETVVTVINADGGADNGDTITWLGETVPAYSGGSPGTTVLTVEMQVNDPIPDGTAQLDNLVREPGGGDPPCPSNQCTRMPTEPKISAAKQLTGETGADAGVAEPGEELTYTVTLSNQGGAATDYALNDVLDPNVSFVDASDNGQLSGDHVEWTGLSVPAYSGGAPGEITLTITVMVDDPLAPGIDEIGNLVKEPGTPDPNCPTDDACTSTPTGPHVEPSKQLTGESGSVAGTAEPGETLTYTITLTNSGGTQETGYALEDDYDDNVTVVDAGGGTDDGNVISWSGLTVPAHDGTNPGTTTLTVEVEVADPLPAGAGRIANIVYEPGETPPSCPSDQCVTTPASPQITFSKQLVDESGPTDGVAEAGETLGYEITLTNNGGATTSYEIHDVLETSVSFASADNGGTHSGAMPGGTVDWTGLTVPAHDGANPGTLVLSADVTVVDPLPSSTTEIRNLVKEDTTGPDPSCPSDACVVTNTQAPELELAKNGVYRDVDGNGFANPGDEIVYSFNVTNTGNVLLEDVVPQDPGPTFDGAAADNGLSAFSPADADLSPGGTQTYTATYPLGTSDIDNAAGIKDSIENTARAVGYVNGTSVSGTPVQSGQSVALLALPAARSDISVAKTAGLHRIQRGQEAPFTITLTNHAGSVATGLTITDTLPPGFRYVEGSATVGGAEVTPTVLGRRVIFDNLSVPGGDILDITLRMLALSSAGPGEHINTATATTGSGRRLAPDATAAVEIVAEPVFDCGDVIGKVFDDTNRNGYQNEGEAGLPGVRVATVKGVLITTDEHGRFHVPCAMLPDQRIGSNFIVKLDTRTLPSGYRLTTENPRVVRLTAGKMTEINFGAAIGRVVRLDLQEGAYVPGQIELRSEWKQGLDRLISVLSQEQSVLRLSYVATGADPELAEDRLEHTSEVIRRRWRSLSDQYRLEIELRMETRQ